MTGESSPNHSSEEQQHFTYDDPNSPLDQEYDPNYVPEREFVLMPLFRRIGEILGIRRNRGGEAHIYEAGSVAMQPRVIDLDQLKMKDPEAIEQEHVRSAARWAESQVPPAPESDVLGIEQEFEPEPAMAAAEAREPKLEPLTTVPEARAEAEPVIVHHEQIEPEQSLAQLAEKSLATPIIASQDERTALVELATTRETRPQPALARPILTQEDIAQFIAPISEAAREAAAKISAAMSQAAEWLHTKEEEIRRRTEQAMESKRSVDVQASATGSPKWESDQAPALQREAAWVETGGIPVARAKEARPVERRPVVLKAKRPALWRRVDWAQEFTPKRVAVLGGVAMAMLMVVGVSLARRPASSVLPQEHPMTHVIQPGGVTLTTHPRTTPVTASATTPTPHAASAPQSQSAPRVRSSRGAAYNDGPDVVTHYYNKQKPSPAHQATTVAGVKHYSDM